MAERSTDTQLRTFIKREGGRYFERNRPVYDVADPATDPPLLSGASAPWIWPSSRRVEPLR